MGEDEIEESGGNGLLEKPATGILVFFLVIVSSYTLILVLGTLVSDLAIWGMEMLFLHPFLYLFQALPRWVAVIMEFGFMGLAGFLFILIPYLLLHFVIMSVLEDTGYLNSVNRSFYRLSVKTGYPCLAITPYALGLGCTISALKALGTAPGNRYKLMTAPFLLMAPCSAKSVLILALVFKYAGVIPALLIFGIDLALVGLGLVLLSRFAKPEEQQHILVTRKLRAPSILRVWDRTRWDLRAFARVGVPLLVLGSIVIGLLRYSGSLAWVGGVLDPVAELLFGFSGMALLLLFVGIFRKELGMQLMAIVAGFSLSIIMSPGDIFVFGLMTMLFIPCLGVVFMVFKMFGWKNGGLMLAGNLGVALAVGVVTRIVVMIVC